MRPLDAYHLVAYLRSPHRRRFFEACRRHLDQLADAAAANALDGTYSNGYGDSGADIQRFARAVSDYEQLVAFEAQALSSGSAPQEQPEGRRPPPTVGDLGDLFADLAQQLQARAAVDAATQETT